MDDDREELSVPDPAPTARERKKPHFRLIIVIAVGILAAILVFQNREPVETNLLWATVEMPRAVLLLTTFLLGVVVGLLVAYLRARQVRK